VSYCGQEQWIIHDNPSNIIDVEIRNMPNIPSEVILNLPQPNDCAHDLSKYELHKISSVEWDSAWRNNRFTYVPDDPLFDSGADWSDQHDRLVHTSFGKLNHWKAQFLKGEPIPMPVFSANDVRVKVGQGRHRIALMRILGLDYFYAAIPKHGVENMKKRDLILE